MTATAPPIDKWTNFLLGIYAEGKPPILGTVDIKEIEEKAREVMEGDMSAYMYTFGSAGTWLTNMANRKALENRPSHACGCVDPQIRGTFVSLGRAVHPYHPHQTTIFGVRYPVPLFVAPVGVQGIMHPDGELATARAAREVGVPFIMNAASSRSIEDIAAANRPDGQRWYQLYWPHTAEVTLSILRRAKENGFTALLITLDTMFLGWRVHDIETAYLPFLYGVGNQVGEVTKFPFDPKGIREAALERGDKDMQEQMMLGKAWIDEVDSGVFRTWEDLKFIRENWDGPIVLKGIQRVSDAEKAIEYGMNGIVVSNHGGRQIDGAIGSLDALDEITRSTKVYDAQRSGKLTVLFDSGIRTGTDIIKALALGAQGVLIGRPFVYGLAIAGQGGVEQILRQTICDLDVSTGLAGYADVNEIIGKRDEILKKLD